MNHKISENVVKQTLVESGVPLRLRRSRREIGSLAFLGLLTVAFFKPLWSLAVYVAGEDLHSHILLIPFIALYLIWIRRKTLPKNYRSSVGLAMVPLAVAIAALTGVWFLRGQSILSENDYRALMSLSFVAFVWAGGLVLLGRAWMKAAVFPLAFLIFLVPLPDRLVDVLETGSKLASAEAANLFFNLTATPFLRDGNVFQLPGITIEVAQECSGIHSSWVLFITSLLASYLFLKTPWRRTLMVALVIPLGILRNGFRIWVIGSLCIHFGPQMIHSVIHHRGGPFFFVLSLIPLFLLLWWLRRGELEVRGTGTTFPSPASGPR